jgi:hypothetical protein
MIWFFLRHLHDTLLIPCIAVTFFTYGMGWDGIGVFECIYDGVGLGGQNWVLFAYMGLGRWD